jgi:hypothetical protein
MGSRKTNGVLWPSVCFGTTHKIDPFRKEVNMKRSKMKKWLIFSGLKLAELVTCFAFYIGICQLGAWVESEREGWLYKFSLSLDSLANGAAVIFAFVFCIVAIFVSIVGIIELIKLNKRWADKFSRKEE